MKYLKDERGVAFIFEVILAAIVLAVVGVAIYASLNAKKTSDSTKSPSTPSASSAPTATPDPYANWLTYTSTAEPSLSFRYPSDWSLKNIGTVYPGNTDGIQLTSAAGTTVRWQSHISGIGGQCDPNKPKHTRKVDALAGAKGLYLVEIGSTSDVTDHLGIVNQIDGKTPVVGPSVDCMGYTVFPSHTTKEAGDYLMMWLDTNGPIKQADIPVVRQILGSLKY